MTTPAKKYQNISYAELLSFADQNPNRHRELEPIEIRPSVQDTSLEKLCLKGYTATNVTPAGILSIVACLADPSYYSLAPPHVRVQQLIDLSTALQIQTDELKHTSLARKRKRIHDLVAGAYNGTRFEDKDYFDLYHGISLMKGLHFILMKESVQDKIEGVDYDSALKGEVLFSSDPTTWKRDHPVWIVDYRGRWIATPSESTAQPIHSILPAWITTIDQKGWMIQWPDVEATKVELVERLSALPGWQETDKKHNKDVLSVRLARALTIKQFTQWSTLS